MGGRIGNMGQSQQVTQPMNRPAFARAPMITEENQEVPVGSPQNVQDTLLLMRRQMADRTEQRLI